MRLAYYSTLKVSLTCVRRSNKGRWIYTRVGKTRAKAMQMTKSRYRLRLIEIT